MAADSPAPNLDPAETERLLLAQLMGRRALAGQVVHRLAPWSRSPALPVHLFPTVLGAPFRGLADRGLQPATYARREAQDQARADRFWWRRVAPHLALLARRRARLRGIPPRAARQLDGESPSRVPGSSTVWPAIAADLAPGAAGFAAANLAPEVTGLEEGEAPAGWAAEDREPAASPAEERSDAAWMSLDPDRRSASSARGSGPVLSPTGSSAGSTGPLRDLRTSAAAVWQRLATVLAPNRRETRIEGGAERGWSERASGTIAEAPREVGGADAMDLSAVPDEEILSLDAAEMELAALAAAEDLSPVSSQEVQGLHGAAPAVEGTEATLQAGPQTLGGGLASDPTAREADVAAEPSADRESPPWIAGPASPTESVAPLAAEIARRLAAGPGGLATSPTAGPSPTRLFWWPTAQAAAHQGSAAGAQLASAAPGEQAGAAPGLPASATVGQPASTSHARIDAMLAPGLLGNLKRAHQAAAAPPERSLELATQIGRADFWARENVAEHERWRVHPTPSQTVDGESSHQTTDSSLEIVYGPSAAPHASPAPGVASGIATGQQSSNSSAAARSPVERPSTIAAPGAATETAGPDSAAGPSAAVVFAGAQNRPVTAQATDSPPESASRPAQPPASTWPLNLTGAPLNLVGGLFGAVTGRRGRPARPTLADDPGSSGPATPAQGDAVPPAGAGDALAGRPPAVDRPVSVPGGPAQADSGAISSGETAEADPPVPVVHVDSTGGRGESQRESTDLFHALARRLTRTSQPRPPATLDDAGAADRSGVSNPPRGAPWSDAARRASPESRAGVRRATESADVLPERPWESSDAELAAVISRLPAPMAAAAIAAGVLGAAAPAPMFEAGASPASRSGWQPFENLTHAPAFPTAPARRETLAQPTAPTLAPAPWAAVEAAHPVGPAWAAAVSAAQAASAASAGAPSFASPAGRAAAASGIARAPIDRAPAEAAPGPGSSPGGAAAAGAPGAPGQPPSGGAAPDLDRLTEEVFDRLRWRLGAERERYLP